MSINKSLSTWTIGKTSLALLLGSTAWLVLTGILTYLPRNNEFGGILTWLGLLVGFGYLLIGIPMILAALITSIISVSNNKGRTLGLITLGTILVSGLTLFIYLIVK